MCAGPVESNAMAIDPVEGVLYFTAEHRVLAVSQDGGDVRTVIEHANEISTIGVTIDYSRR